MSDNDSGTPAAASGAAFTERELQMLGWAMRSLKTGPPEIDYEKLAAFAGMGNPRSASNAWAKIKGKLMTNPDGTPMPTPKKAPAAKGKKSKDAAAEDGSESPTKKVATPRKRVAKKQEIDGGEVSPKKKSKAAAKEDEAKIKAEENGEEELRPEAKAEAGVEEENVEDRV